MTRLSMVLCLLVAISILTYSATNRAARERAELGARAVCYRNIHELSMALRSSALRDHDAGKPSRDWSSMTRSTVVSPDRLRCPSRPEHTSGYALNAAMVNRDVTTVSVPEKTVLIFESDVGWNAVGGPGILPSKPRHGGGDNYGFADSSVRWLPRRKLSDGSWAKEPDADWVIWKPVLKKDAKAKVP